MRSIVEDVIAELHEQDRQALKGSPFGKNPFVVNLLHLIYTVYQKPVSCLAEADWNEIEEKLKLWSQSDPTYLFKYSEGTYTPAETILKQYLNQVNGVKDKYSIINGLFKRTGIRDLSKVKLITREKVYKVANDDNGLDNRERALILFLFEGFAASMTQFKPEVTKTVGNDSLTILSRIDQSDIEKNLVKVTNQQGLSFTFHMTPLIAQICKSHQDDLDKGYLFVPGKSNGLKRMTFVEGTRFFRALKTNSKNEAGRGSILGKFFGDIEFRTRVFGQEISPLRDLEANGIVDYAAIASAFLNIDINNDKLPLEYACVRFGIKPTYERKERYYEYFKSIFKDASVYDLQKKYLNETYKLLFHDMVTFYNFALNNLQTSEPAPNSSMSSQTDRGIHENPEERTDKDDEDIGKDAEKKKSIGDINEKRVMAALEKINYTVRQVRHFYGYDLFAYSTTNRIYVEVKTLTESNRFYMTKREYEILFLKVIQKDYRIAFVKDKIYLLDNVAERFGFNCAEQLFGTKVTGNDIFFEPDNIILTIPYSILNQATIL